MANPISDITIQEDADLGSLSISSLFDDIDHDNSSIVISATSSNNSLLYVSVDGDFLYYEALPNTHGSAVVTLTGTSNGLTANDDFTVSITSVNDATSITGDFNVTLQEDGIATGDLNATDPDGLSDGTYFLVSSDPANGPHPSIRPPVPGTTPLIRIFTGLILSPYQLPTIRTTPLPWPRSP